VTKAALLPSPVFEDFAVGIGRVQWFCTDVSDRSSWRSSK
jgi:hypothetical protein